MHLAIPGPSTHDDESDEDLLLAVAAGDPHERDAAAAATVRRYAGLLFQYCRREYRYTLGGDDGVKDLVLQTFQKAFDNATTYRPVEGGDADGSRARTFSWLTSIADNAFRDWIKSPSEMNPLPLRAIGTGGDGEPVHGTQVDIDEMAFVEDGSHEGDGNEDRDPLLRSKEGQVLRAALNALPDREREALMLEARFSAPGEQLRIPDHERNDFCDRWGTTPEYLRTIRKRAREAVEAYCASHAPS
jgi:DNA-directed RNA polymerase specialized sigma24 family protein